MTKRIKGWMIERSGKSLMEMEFLLNQKDPLFFYRVYFDIKDAEKSKAAYDVQLGCDTASIKEALLIYRE